MTRVPIVPGFAFMPPRGRRSMVVRSTVMRRGVPVLAHLGDDVAVRDVFCPRGGRVVLAQPVPPVAMPPVEVTMPLRHVSPST